MQYAYEGRTLQLDAAKSVGIFKESVATVCSIEVDGGKITHVFRTETTFRSWVKSSPLAERIAKIDALIDDARRLENGDHTRAKSRQQILSERMAADMQELAERLKVDVRSPEFLEIARRPHTVLEPPVLHSAILYDGSDATGTWKPIQNGIPYPVLAWLNFDNKTTSTRGFSGLLRLSDSNWFGGTSKYWGVPGEVWELANEGFDNRASSAVLV